jgi:hypothetical protein
MSFNLIEWFQLRNIRKEQQQTNDLLDQIWLQGLTPAERAREQSERAAYVESQSTWLNRCKANWNK